MPYCIDIILLILILFSLVNNSLCVIMPKALLNSEEIKSSELSLSRKVFIFSKKRDQVSLAQSTSAAFYLIFHSINQCKPYTPP